VKPHIPPYTYFVYPISPIRTVVSHEHPLELGWIQPRKRRGTVTSQHILYYCTYYSVSFTCTVHCTIDIHTLYVTYMFPVSLFPMLRFHLQHLFTTLVHTYISVHLVSFTSGSVTLVACLLLFHRYDQQSGS
jgi:hypothetical protein